MCCEECDARRSEGNGLKKTSIQCHAEKEEVRTCCTDKATNTEKITLLFHGPKQEQHEEEEEDTGIRTVGGRYARGWMSDF